MNGISTQRLNLRRKLKSSARLRVEWRTQAIDILADVMRLYRSTLANAQYAFEDLTEEYFTATLVEMDSRALCAKLLERLARLNRHSPELAELVGRQRR